MFTFWGESHKTQTSALKAFRAYADTLPLNKAYRPTDPEFVQLCEAIQFNAEWAPLLDDITTLTYVRERGSNSKRAMEAQMRDQGKRKVSWTRSFENRTEWDILMSTLSLEVTPQIEAYAEPFRKMSDPRSELPGDPQPLFVNGKWVGHVDHINPKFRDIARRFIYEIGGHPSLLPLPTGGRRISDPKIRRWWREVPVMKDETTGEWAIDYPEGFTPSEEPGANNLTWVREEADPVFSTSESIHVTAEGEFTSESFVPEEFGKYLWGGERP